MTQDIRSLRFYETAEHACSYLSNRKAKTLFVDPDAKMSSELYSALSLFGFRRSGAHIYRPRCEKCEACIPVRIAVDDFKFSRSHKRCLAKNEDIVLQDVDSIDTEEHYALYDRYITERHHDGDMFPPDLEQYRSFLSNEWGVTRYIEMRLQKRLVGVAVTDGLNDGLSAVYTFFEPSLLERSLGVFAILSQIQRAKAANLPYVYLGYWIKACSKMNYKTQYRPLQMLANNRWVEIS